MKSEKIRIPLVPECSACILNSLKVLIPNLTEDDEQRYRLFTKAFHFLEQGYDRRIDPLTLSVALYQELYNSTRNSDPYYDLKQLSRIAAEKALPRVKVIIESKKGFEQLRAALAAAIAGNVIDFNTAGHNPDLNALERTYNEILDTGFAIDDSHFLWDTLNETTGNLVYLGDNAGEVLFDIPLISIISKLGWNVIFVVKGKAMINDATIEDIEGTDIESITTVITTGAWAFGTPRAMVSDEFLNTVRSADLIISKGQANIESFPEIADELSVETYYLLRGKCAHITSRLGAAKGDNIVLKHSTFKGSS